jgi:hypothetical protein
MSDYKVQLLTYNFWYIFASHATKSEHTQQEG